MLATNFLLPEDTKKDDTTNKTETPKKGDYANVVVNFLTMGICVAVIVMVICQKRIVCR